jgi:hypothetical protein
MSDQTSELGKKRGKKKKISFRGRENMVDVSVSKNMGQTLNQEQG